ncbi:MAG: hypothetical protein KGJ77_11780, partial [Acidobacteriota bacterium]|nr:hypothetical protein [Acidobacteriota bacterium]
PPPATTEMTLRAPSAVPAAPLVLRRASKRILVVFVVLGVLGYGAVVGVDAVAFTSTSSSQAFVDAHTTLQSQLNAAEGQRASCTLGQVPCLDQFWTQLSSDFGQFGASLSGISVPASAQADKTKLQTDTSALGALLQQLSSEDPSSISQAQLSQLQSLSTGFDADSVRLADGLS